LSGERVPFDTSIVVRLGGSESCGRGDGEEKGRSTHVEVEFRVKKFEREVNGLECF